MPASVHLGILAGGGSVPKEVAAAAVARGWPVHVVAIDGEADADFGTIPVTRVNWGQVGRMIRTFKDKGATHLVIVGRVSRPDLTRIKPDFGLLASIPRILRIIASGGDDGVLRSVIQFFEGHGFAVLGPADVAPDLVVGQGPAGTVMPTAEDEHDIAIGLDLVCRLGPFDVGQCVAVSHGGVTAIEGAEGTDRMLARIVTGPASTGGKRRGVLVKRPKPGQDMRVDMPTIGPDTVSRVARAGLDGIAVLAGQVLATQRDELVRRANAEGVFVSGVSEAPAARHHEQRSAAPFPDVRARDQRDIARAIAVMDCLRPEVCSRAVVVARNYVLAIETGEGIGAVVQRVASLRQWGSARIRRRAGIAVVTGEVVVDEELMGAAAAAGLRGIAMLPGPKGTPALPETALRRARTERVLVYVLPPDAGGWR